MTTLGNRDYTPAIRRLRVFASDPIAGTRLETAELNQVMLAVPWETGPGGDPLVGPVGEYLEVVDIDPASDAFYAPVNLDDPHVIAQDGLDPSESSPQFHQQMVYAVAMNTIGHFETALGRVALWAAHKPPRGKPIFVRRLRIYPHALREANAYYSPAKKALLFGYFPLEGGTARGTVFTCLSHDIIAHETTHALLDGLHPRFNEATNPDVHALHEGFADIVALFQHFSNPALLTHQIARTRGDLESQNSLGQLAQQFGAAVGRRGGLRDALGAYGDDGVWRRHDPDPRRFARTTQPHARGALLVAAVFDAFLFIYKSRVADLLRIATQGTGVLPVGDIHPDLVKRMAGEAAKSARHVLQMCIRALDYCPPVDVTFGSYLRALVTADYDLNQEDAHDYRIAFVQAFRAWGIHPPEVRAFSVDAIRYAPLPWKELPAGVPELWPAWDLRSDREQAWETMRENAKVLHDWIRKQGPELARPFGICLDPKAPPTVFRDRRGRVPSFEVHSVRTAVRRGERGATVREFVVEITQRRRGFLDPDRQKAADEGKLGRRFDFLFRRGCTLLVDPSTMHVRHVIKTAGDVTDDRELARVRDFLNGEPAEGEGDDAFHVERRFTDPYGEDFAAMHRGG